MEQGWHVASAPLTCGIVLDGKVWDRERVVIIPDHYIFTADPRANRNVDILRDFVNEQNIKYVLYSMDKKVIWGQCSTGLDLMWCWVTIGISMTSRTEGSLRPILTTRASVTWL